MSESPAPNPPPQEPGGAAVLSSGEVDRLLRAALDLAGARDVARVAEAVRGAARELTGADGVTFVLREGSVVHYLDEEAIAPLWKGRRFPADACISGWAMLNRQTVVIDDVFRDDRIPHEAYRPTFVKSLAMVPVRPEEPVAAIGAYWAGHHRATARELRHLTTLAGFAAVALANEALVAELRGALAARDTFLEIASHELRTPLSALTLALAIAERQLPAGAPPDRMRGALDRISRSAKRLTHLVERLLDVTTLGHRRIALRREEVDLAALAHAAAEALRGRGKNEVRVDAPAPVVGWWDRARIEQVVQDLLANAVKFGPGRPVDLAVTASGGNARVEVRDRGIGIHPEAQERIFGRFERAVPVTSYGGLGVGLWLVRQAVQAHGGTVDVASAPGDGATFAVTLPLR